MSAFATNSEPGLDADNIRHAFEGASSWIQLVKPIEPFLDAVRKRLSEQVNEFDSSIADKVAYALESQGKQIRPVLLALSGKSTGELTDYHVTAAVIIEIVHLATLVHDDVIDGAKIRRGKPTVAANWGNDITVLLGDCLFAHALKLTANYPTTEVCRAVSSATNTVCAGEIFQTQLEGQFNFTKAEYFKALEMKTGELFALSCELGAYLSGASGKYRKLMREFGLALGTAYQIYDDCLDLFGDETEAGKSLGTDIAKGKLTLPVLLLLEVLDNKGVENLKKMVINWEASYFPKLKEMLRANNIFETSLKHFSSYIHKSKESLYEILKTEKVTSPECLIALDGICDFLYKQTEKLGTPLS
jgi:octaprenyl-diphosphate synthase